MSADPKPPPKAPKMPRPIVKKRATARRYKSPRCDVRGCKFPQKVITGDVGAPAWINESTGFCDKHARHEAARLWSLVIRTGRCDVAEWHQRLGVKCGGSIVGCHGFGKGAYPSVRYELWNGFSGCSGINQWTEDHPLEWDDYLRATWGPLYEEHRQAALTVRKYDLSEVLFDLRAALAARKAAA